MASRIESPTPFLVRARFAPSPELRGAISLFYDDEPPESPHLYSMRGCILPRERDGTATLNEELEATQSQLRMSVGDRALYLANVPPTVASALETHRLVFTLSHKRGTPPFSKFIEENLGPLDSRFGANSVGIEIPRAAMTNDLGRLAAARDGIRTLMTGNDLSPRRFDDGDLVVIGAQRRPRTSR